MLISRRGRLRLADGRCGAQQLTSTDCDRVSNFFNRSFISHFLWKFSSDRAGAWPNLWQSSNSMDFELSDNRQIVWMLNSAVDCRKQGEATQLPRALLHRFHPVSATCRQAKFPWKLHRNRTWWQVAETGCQVQTILPVKFRARILSRLFQICFLSMYLVYNDNLFDQKCMQSPHYALSDCSWVRNVQCTILVSCTVAKIMRVSSSLLSLEQTDHSPCAR